MAASDERQVALTSALAQIERQFGKGSIMRMGDFQERMAFEVVPTGSISLDLALGVGGLPRGRIVEIYGPESSGKTTLALHAIAEAQRIGGTAAFIDVEHALDPNYAAALGVDLDNLLVSQPDTGEQALDIAEMLTRSNAVDVIGCRIGYQGGARGRYGRYARRFASASDVASTSQANVGDIAQQSRHDLYQSVAREDRRHVR
jgi:recombination protein RecA